MSAGTESMAQSWWGTQTSSVSLRLSPAKSRRRDSLVRPALTDGRSNARRESHESDKVKTDGSEFFTKNEPAWDATMMMANQTKGMRKGLITLLLLLLERRCDGFLVSHALQKSAVRSLTTRTTYCQAPSADVSSLFASITQETAPESLTNDDDDNIKFDEMGLAPEICANIPWKVPTPIQSLAIPQMIREQETSNTNVWLQAPTGSGKTLVYGSVLWHKLQEQHLKNNAAAGIRSLVLAPTRELAVQIASELEQLAPSWNARVGLVHGGVPKGPQLELLFQYRHLDVLVATPGRLVDLLVGDAEERADTALQHKLTQALNQQSAKGDVSLSLQQLQDLDLSALEDEEEVSEKKQQQAGSVLANLEYLVVDEADRLLSRGFETEMDALIDLIRPSKGSGSSTTTLPLSTWLFSATFPKAIEPRVDHVLRRLGSSSDSSDPQPPIRISCVQSDRLVDTDDEVSASLQKRLDRSKSKTPAATPKHVERITPASTIQLRTIRVTKPDRTQVLRRLLETHQDEWDRVLVFCGTRYTTQHVARKLRRYGISAAELHGKLDQDARLRRLRALEQGRTRVLLASDIASRGLDIEGLPAVVNYDLPRSTTDFVHRVGRTGRAGRPGTAVTLVTPDAESHLDLIEKRHLAAGTVVEREVLPGFVPDEDEWAIQSEASRLSIPGVKHSERGLTHDRMHGGIKGKRKSKKDRLREKAAREAAAAAAAAANPQSNDD